MFYGTDNLSHILERMKKDADTYEWFSVDNWRQERLTKAKRGRKRDDAGDILRASLSAASSARSSGNHSEAFESSREVGIRSSYQSVNSIGIDDIDLQMIHTNKFSSGGNERTS